MKLPVILASNIDSLMTPSFDTALTEKLYGVPRVMLLNFALDPVKFSVLISPSAKVTLTVIVVESEGIEKLIMMLLLITT